MTRTPALASLLLIAGCQSVPEYLQPVIDRCGESGALLNGQSIATPSGAQIHAFVCAHERDIR